jgi:hypothetical protein
VVTRDEEDDDGMRCISSIKPSFVAAAVVVSIAACGDADRAAPGLDGSLPAASVTVATVAATESTSTEPTPATSGMPASSTTSVVATPAGSASATTAPPPTSSSIPPLADGVIGELDPGPLSPRYRAATAAVGGRLLVYGGVADGVALDDGAVFDPTTGTWEMLPSSGGIAAGASDAAADGTRVVLAGQTSAAAFDLANGTWSPLPPPPDATGAVLATDRALFSIVEGSAEIPAMIHRLDAGAASWVTLPAVPAGGPLAGVHVHDGRPVVVQLVASDGPDGAAFVLDGDTWRDLAMPDLNWALGLTSTLAGDDLLVWGGDPPGQPGVGNTDGLAYSFLSGEWRRIAPLPNDWWECYTNFIAYDGVVRGDVCGVVIEYDVPTDKMTALGVLDASDQVGWRWIDVDGTAYRWGTLSCYAECDPLPPIAFQRWA